MKKIISWWLIIFFILFVCSCQRINEKPEQVTNTPENIMKNDISLDYFNCKKNSSTIVEDMYYVYFGKEDGLYAKEKKSGNIIKIDHIPSPDYLEIVDNMLYFKSEEKLYQYSSEYGCKVVFEAKTSIEKEAIAQDYQIYDNQIFFFYSLGLAIFDLYSKEFIFIPELSSISMAEIRNDTLYYIEQERNLFFSYNLNTGEKYSLFDDMAIKDFVFTNQLYVQQADKEKIYSFEYNAENSIMGYVFEEKPVVYMQNIDGYFIYVCKNNNKYSIYSKFDVIGELEYFDIQNGMCIIDGKAYFSANGNPTYIELKNFYSTKQNDHRHDLLALKAYNMFPKISFVEQQSFVDKITFLQIVDKDIYNENFGLLVIGKKGTHAIWKNEYICRTMQTDSYDKDVVITKSKVYFLADTNLYVVSAEDGTEILTINDYYNEITSSLDGRYIIMADYFGVRLGVFDTETETVTVKTPSVEINECYELWTSENNVVALCKDNEGNDVAVAFSIQNLIEDDTEQVIPEQVVVLNETE